MSKTKKNGRVEFLRFIFALGILFFHIHKRFAEDGNIPIGHTGYYFFNHGYIGVEFFFLVSGYLLAAGAFAKADTPTDLIGTETAQVMWKKIKNIFPYHLFAIIITIIVNAIYLEETTQARLNYLVDSWASVFFLQVFGFDSTWVNKLTWYLDVWLMVTYFFYYFLRKHYDTFVKIVCPLVALFVLGYLAHEYDGLAGVDGWTDHFYKCFLRGMSEMALGCSAYSMTRRLNKVHFTTAGKWAMGIAEVAGYLTVLRFACSAEDPKYSFPTLFIMCCTLIITFSDINPGHFIFDHPVFSWLGKLSLLIYLNQFYCIRLVQSLLPDLSFYGKVLVCTILTFIGAFICDGVVLFFNKKRPFSKLFIKGE